QRKGGLLEVRDTQSGLLRVSRHLPITTAWRTPGNLGAFSGDARLLAAVTAADGNVVHVWDAESGRRLPGACRHSVEVWHVAASDDGLVASAARGIRGMDVVAELAVWDPATGRAGLRVTRNSASGRCLAIRADGRQVAQCLHLLARSKDPDGRRLTF